MKKVMLFFIFMAILYSIPITGQSSIIYLKNGEKIEGLSKIGKRGSIIHRKNKKDKKSIIKPEEIDSIIIQEDFLDYVYHYRNIKDKKEGKLLKLLYSGKVILYGIFSKEQISKNFNFGEKYNIEGMYVSKNIEGDVVFLGSSNKLPKTFRKNTSEYFKDCPELVKKIENKEFKLRDIKDIVKFYDKKCN